MLVQLQKLEILNEGYKREISLKKIFVNSSHVVSIRDYIGAKQFLLSEGNSDYDNSNFSLVKILNGMDVEEVIVLGTSEQIYDHFAPKSGKKLLNE